MRKTKISAQEKLHTVKNILHGIESIHAAAKRLSVDPSAVRVWICSYKGNGIDAFTHIKNNYYSHECKVQAVTAYLNQEGSLSAICQRFGLRSPTQLRRWIKRYNSHEELKASGTGGFSIMTKGRKTTAAIFFFQSMLLPSSLTIRCQMNVVSHPVSLKPEI